MSRPRVFPSLAELEARQKPRARVVDATEARIVSSIRKPGRRPLCRTVHPMRPSLICRRDQGHAGDHFAVTRPNGFTRVVTWPAEGE